MNQRKHGAAVAIHGTGCVLARSALRTDLRRVDQNAAIVESRKVPDSILAEGTGLSRRDLKKMDRMSMLALFAARSAISEAALSADEITDCGIFTGNAVAGWTFTEPQLRSLYYDGLSNISPYLASAWFPAAAQGQIAIHMRLLGYAKTIATDRCAGTQAIGLAAAAVRAGRVICVLAGAAEAPLAPFVEGASRHAGQSDVELVEGAAYLVLGEPASHRTTIAEVVDHISFTLPVAMAARLALLSKQLTCFYERNREVGEKVDVMIDSRNSIGRGLVARVQEHNWICEAQLNSVVPGDALAATGPATAVLVCQRYVTSDYRLPAMIISLGHDFASAILLRPTE
jgi:hypothetical protein